jgi:uroporphyrinogen-III synthase
MTRVLVLRPEPGASATVERARLRSLHAVAIPLFEVEAVSWDAPEASAFDGLLLTSANAVRSGGDQLKQFRGLRVYAVGDATAQAARDAGFDVARAGDAGVGRLLASLEPELRLLHLAGEDRKRASGARQHIETITVYRSKPLEYVDLARSEGSVAIIHSPRAGRRFAELVDQAHLDRSKITIAAISPDAAEAVGARWARADSAEAPNEDALLALAERLCNKVSAT